MTDLDGYDWRPTTNRPQICRRPGCPNPATVPDLDREPGYDGLCDMHLLLVRAGRAAVGEISHKAVGYRGGLDKAWRETQP